MMVLLWRDGYGELCWRVLTIGLGTDTILRDYTATYWPNRGIKGHELQTIYGKIIASDKSIADAASPSGG
jgi:hypothetical protein